MIDRPYYLQWLERWRDKDVIKTVTGLRRCGKSSILRIFRDKLKEDGVADENIISINFESLDDDYPTEARSLYRYVKDRLSSGKNYVFLDEVQHVNRFEEAVDALYVREDVDLYITGSNAYFLSGELATLLTGRYVELRMLPLSFSEFRSAYGSEHSTEALFDRYLTYGGLPYITRLDSDEDRADYLGGVFNTIVMKDVAMRHPRMNMRSFMATASFLADNVGSLSSQQRIAAGLKGSDSKASPATIGEYIDAILENYLFFQARRYDLKGREYLSTLEKYYLGDMGFRFWLLGKERGDVGHRLENVVYLELLRRFRSASVGKCRSGEIDFVAMGDGALHYYQVSASVLDEETFAREIKPLQRLKDNYPKTLLTLDRIGNGDVGGISQVNVIDWLLGKS